MDILRLTEEQKARYIHLPIKQAIYVPSTRNVSTRITELELIARVDTVSSFLAKIFGGYSVYDLKGGYVTHTSGGDDVVKEHFVRVVSFAHRETFKENQQKLFEQISTWAKEWGQESVGYEFEEDLYYIPK